MTVTKQKSKGFSFTIDSLISPDRDTKPQQSVEDNVALPNASIPVQVSPSALIRTAAAPMLPDEGDLRVDEELSECSDTSVQICGTRHSGRSTPVSDLSDLSSSTPPPDSSLENLDAPVIQRKKKARTAFSQSQIDELEKRYETQRYLTATERGDLAEELGLTDQQVKTWFQNRRMKEKRQRHERHDGPVFPTGGVDVAQLHALGIACPLPPVAAQQFPPSPSVHAASRVPTSPFLPSPIGPVFPNGAPCYPPLALPHHRVGGMPFFNPYAFPFHHGMPAPAFGPGL